MSEFREPGRRLWILWIQIPPPWVTSRPLECPQWHCLVGLQAPAQGGGLRSLVPLSLHAPLCSRCRSCRCRCLCCAAGLRRLRDVGAGWLTEAQPVLEQEFVTDDQLGLLEGLIASGQRLGLALEQVDILRANVEGGRRVVGGGVGGGGCWGGGGEGKGGECRGEWA